MNEYNNESIENGVLLTNKYGGYLHTGCIPQNYVLNCNFVMKKVQLSDDILKFYEKVLNNTDKEQFWEQFTENVENHDDFEISFTKEHGWKLGDDIIKQFSEIWLELFEEMDDTSQWVSVMIMDDDDDPAMRGECEADFSYWQRMKEHLIY
tara:strand:- start:412 stop:864 length:453 start_codon:yes stop_codon:yes gene_type:complete